MDFNPVTEKDGAVTVRFKDVYRVLNIDTPYRKWRASMVQEYGLTAEDDFCTEMRPIGAVWKYGNRVPLEVAVNIIKIAYY